VQTTEVAELPEHALPREPSTNGISVAIYGNIWLCYAPNVGYLATTCSANAHKHLVFSFDF